MIEIVSDIYAKGGLYGDFTTDNALTTALLLDGTHVKKRVLGSMAFETASNYLTDITLNIPNIFTPSSKTLTPSDDTYTFSLASQTANYVFAAPNGLSGTPSFRALVAADIPSLSGTYALTGGSNATGTWPISITGNAATATNSTQWNGAVNSFGADGVSIDRIIGYDFSGTPTVRYYNAGTIKTFLESYGGTWGISISGNAATATNSTQWNGQTYVGTVGGISTYMMAWNGSQWGAATASLVQSFLGLGSNAYTSTAYLPLTGGTLTGALNGTSATFSGNVVWGSNNNGHPRSARIGYSGGNYGGIGYAVTFTGTNDVHNYALDDVPTLVSFYNGIQVQTSTTATAAGKVVGDPITWTTILDVKNGTFSYLGNTVYHSGNFTPGNYVPYTGANAHVQLGPYDLNAQYVWVGRSGSGFGGNIRYKGDDGNNKWAGGILGSVGATDWQLYNYRDGSTAMSVTYATNVVYFANDVYARDFRASRGDGTGVIYLNSAGDRYLYYDGTKYVLPVANIEIGGDITLDGGGVVAGGSASVTLNDTVGAKIGWGSTYLTLDSVASTTVVGGTTRLLINTNSVTSYLPYLDISNASGGIIRSTTSGTSLFLSSGGSTTDVRINYNYSGGSGGLGIYDGGVTNALQLTVNGSGASYANNLNKHSFNGQIESTHQGRFQGWFVSGSGEAVEIGWSAGAGYVVSYDRTNGNYENLWLQGSSVKLSTEIGAILQVSSSVVDVYKYVNIDLAGAGGPSIVMTNTTGKQYEIYPEAAGFGIYNRTDGFHPMFIYNSGETLFSGGTAMTAGWTRNLILQGSYPVIVFNSTSGSTKGGLGYDGGGGFYWWTGASGTDVSGTGTASMALNTSGQLLVMGSGGFAIGGWSGYARINYSAPHFEFRNSSNNLTSIQAEDLYAIRNGVTGALFLGNQSGGGRYLYYDGAYYQLPGTGIVVGGNSTFAGKIEIGSATISGITASSVGHLLSRFSTADGANHFVGHSLRSQRTTSTSGSVDMTSLEGLAESTHSSGNVYNLNGVTGTLYHSGAGTISFLKNHSCATVIATGTGLVGSVANFEGAVPVILGTGALTTYYGLLLKSGDSTTLAKITNYHPIYQQDTDVSAKNRLGAYETTPLVNNHSYLGSVSLRWKNVYSTDGDFEGTVTAASFINSNAVGSDYLMGDGSVRTGLIYGCFVNNGTKSFSSSNSLESIPFADEIIKNGITHSTGTNPDWIEFDTDGVYEIIFQAQVEDGGTNMTTEIRAYIEYWDGSNWSTLADSGARVNTYYGSGITVYQVNIAYQAYFNADTIIRVVMDTDNHSYHSLVSLDGIPAARITLKRLM